MIMQPIARTCQRDEGERIFSLTLENLRAIGELASSLKP